MDHQLTKYADSLAVWADEVAKSDQLPIEVAEFLARWVKDPEPLKEILNAKWRDVLHLVFTIFEKHPSFYSERQNNSQSLASKSVSQITCALLAMGSHQQVYDYLTAKLTVYTQPQTQLIIFESIVEISTTSKIPVPWGRQLTLQLRMSGVILHNFLKSKKQKASSTQDKLQHEIEIEKHCESWIQEFLCRSLASYSGLLQTDQTLRRYFINFGCDLAAALLQGFVESLLDKDMLIVLLGSLEKVMAESYTVAEMAAVFGQTLTRNQMKSPVKQLDIVEIYSEQDLLNPSGYSYMMYRLLVQPISQFVNSDETVLRGVLSSLGESIKRQLPTKHDILEFGQRFISGTKLRPRSDNEFGYPISLLIVNLVQSQENESEFTNNKINNILKVITGWNWSLSQCIDFSTGISSKKYVLQHMNSTNNFDNYYVLYSLQPAASENDFSQLLAKTLIKVKELPFPWVKELIKDKMRDKYLEQKLK